MIVGARGAENTTGTATADSTAATRSGAINSQIKHKTITTAPCARSLSLTLPQAARDSDCPEPRTQDCSESGDTLRPREESIENSTQ